MFRNNIEQQLKQLQEEYERQVRIIEERVSDSAEKERAKRRTKEEMERRRMEIEEVRGRREFEERLEERLREEELLREEERRAEKERRQREEEMDKIKKLTYYGHGYSFQDNSFSLSAEKKEELGKFYKNREKEIKNYKREKSLRQNRPTREEKIWNLEEQLESLDNNLKADESELVFLEWRLEQNNTLRGEVSEKKVLRQQSIKKLKIQKEMREKLKDYEIKALKKNSGESQKEFLSEKMTLWMSDSNLQKLEVIKLLILKTKQEKLEVFATEIGIELQKTQNLCKRYRELISAQEENRGNDIAIAKENIEATREGLLERGISNSKVGKFCRKCKKVAQLEVWIEKIQEQYEAKQEVPLYNRRN